jgi:NH3-dependent NAD+ synthetase
MKINETQIKKPKIEQIYDALIFAIKNEFERLGFEKVVIGLSG